MSLLPFQAIWFIGVIFAWVGILAADGSLAELGEMSFTNPIGQAAFVVFSLTPPLTLFALRKKQRPTLYAAVFANVTSLLYSMAAVLKELNPSNAMILLALFAPVVGVLGSLGGLSTLLPLLRQKEEGASSDEAAPK